MTETPRNAIDTALIKLNLASQYLEITRPSKTDVKKAGEASKDASDILKACLVLLDHDCYSVQDPPQGAPTPLFKPDGQPQAAADVTAEGGAEADMSRPALGCIDVEIVPTRKFKVGDHVKEISSDEMGTVREDDEDDEENAPYKVEFDNGEEVPMSASELEMVQASEEDENQVGKLEIINEPFPLGKKTAQKKVFNERLDTLENCFCDAEEATGRDNYQAQLKAFRPHRNAWAERWEADAQAAWKAILTAIATATYAKNGEFTAWAPEVVA